MSKADLWKMMVSIRGKREWAPRQNYDVLGLGPVAVISNFPNRGYTVAKINEGMKPVVKADLA